MKKRIKIFGERNSGTNYLTQLIQENTSIEIIKGTAPKIINAFPFKENIKDLYFERTSNKNLGWKHAAIDKEEIEKNPEIAVITISKNPYAWLLSMHKRPYHGEKKTEFLEFIKSPWKARARDRIETSTVKNPICLWNIKNSSYITNHEQKKSYHISYEDLLKSPEETLQKAFIELEIGKFNLQKNISRSTKSEEKDFNFYREYYTKKEWLKKLTPATVDEINNHLDFDLMLKIGYSRESL